MDTIIAIIGLIIIFGGYLVRMELKYTEITTDLKWIKEYLSKCQQL